MTTARGCPSGARSRVLQGGATHALLAVPLGASHWVHGLLPLHAFLRRPQALLRAQQRQPGYVSAPHITDVYAAVGAAGGAALRTTNFVGRTRASTLQMEAEKPGVWARMFGAVSFSSKVAAAPPANPAMRGLNVGLFADATSTKRRGDAKQGVRAVGDVVEDKEVRRAPCLRAARAALRGRIDVAAM